jgi:plastocyanin
MMFFFLFLSLILTPVVSLAEEARTYDIVIQANVFKFEPDKLTIKAGDTVRWHNKDERKHVLTSVERTGPLDELEIFSEDDLHSGGFFSHTFKEPGEYPYYCFIHNKMTGLITVVGKEKQQ